MSDYMRNRKSLSSIADAYRAMYAKPNEEILNEELIDSIIEDVREEEIEDIAKYLDENKDLDEGALADKAKKSGISVGTLRKVYNRGMAAWKTGHRPGTTPQQWGMARVNAFIVKKKKGGLNHDKDLAHVIHPDDNMLEALTTMPDAVKDKISRLRNKKMDVKYDSDEYHRIQKQIDSLMRQYSPKKESLDEVKKQEVDAMKKVSKDMQSVLKSYQKIANMGDKELKNTIHNKDYKKVLDARDTILKMIGTLNTKMLMQKENFEIVEASAGEMIDKLFNAGGDRMMTQGIAKLLNMTDVKVALAMQKQNPDGFRKTTFAMGADNKNRSMIKDKDLMKMFKKAGVKPIPEGVEEQSEDSVEKTVEKLTERNMLGRLAKQLKLNEEGKQKMFAYFEKGELKQ